MSGFVRVSIRSATLARADGVAEDDFKSWALVQLVREDGAASCFWYSGGEALGKTSVANGLEAAPYNYARQSKAVELSAGALSELAASKAVVSVYAGGSRDSDKDALIGSFTVPLRALLVGGAQVRGTFVLQPPAIATLSPAKAAPATAGAAAAAVYSGSVSAEFRADSALEAYCIGCRLLDLPTLSLHGIPKRWRLPESEWADVEDSRPGENVPADAKPANAAAVYAMCTGEHRRGARRQRARRQAQASEG